MLPRADKPLRRPRLPVALLLGLLLSALWSTSSAVTRMPSANRECATCHIMWLDEFKREDVTPLIPYEPLPVTDSGKQDAASTERMCFSCHDGFVLDSRFLWEQRGHTHPIGVKPSDKVQIPSVKGKDLFPMNNDGKMYCGTCHTAHGVDWQSKDSPIFLRMKNVNSKMCMACHLNRSTGPEQGNHPIHKKLGQPPAKLVESGSKFDQKQQVICQSCHRIHGAEGRRLLVVDNKRSDLCTNCHTDKKFVNNSKHDLSLTSPGSSNALGHKPKVDGPCSACHIPHHAKGDRLWARKLADGVNEASAKCLTCHTPKGPAHKKTIGPNSHPLNVPVSRLGITAGEKQWSSKHKDLSGSRPIEALPLFDSKGKRAAKGGQVSCLTCHDPHRWSARHGNPPGSDPRKLKGDGSTSFLRIANNGDSLLCSNCHRDKQPVKLSKHNLSISARSEKNSDGLDVKRSGVCSACHLPHNGEGSRMWAKKLVGDETGIEALCVSCHSENGVADEKQVGKHSHPLHKSIEKIAGHVDLPLFLNNSKQDPKGLVDCASCHDPHQWDPNNPSSRAGASANAEGDTGNSFLRLPAGDNAKLCVECHKDKAYIIDTDHDMRVTAPDATNSKGQTVRKTGVCGQCHSVHNAETATRLWARSGGEGRGPDVMANLCLSCHDRDSIAKAKVPEEYTHPDRLVPSHKGRLRSEAPDGILPPVFSNKGKTQDAGEISCPTCHNPHQWQADKNAKGMGKNLEGDTRDSFLRHANTDNFLCADCHGKDSLYRYKYFHWKKSRENKEYAAP